MSVNWLWTVRLLKLDGDLNYHSPLDIGFVLILNGNGPLYTKPVAKLTVKGLFSSSAPYARTVR